MQRKITSCTCLCYFKPELKHVSFTKISEDDDVEHCFHRVDVWGLDDQQIITFFIYAYVV